MEDNGTQMMLETSFCVF